MKKEKILIIYYEMVIGGSTTSLLSLLNCIDTEKYDVYLRLYKYAGPLFDCIPKKIQLLPAASKSVSKICKVIKLLRGNYVYKAIEVNRRLGLTGFSKQVLAMFQAKELSEQDNIEYDYAISFLEGWSDYYLAEKVNAKKKYGWYHSTLQNASPDIEFEYDWIRKVDNVALVADNVTEDFKRRMPEFSHKAITINNILDECVVRGRAQEPVEDPFYNTICNEQCIKIITVCRMDINVKGLDRIVSCAKHLKEEGYRFLWVLLGSSPEQRRLNEMIQAANVGDCLITIGAKLNPYPYISISDIFCLASRVEGKPMTVTEAMILETVPVVTNYLSAHSQIKDGVDGLIADNNDDDIYNKLKLCFDNPEYFSKIKQVLKDSEYGNVNYIKEIEKRLFQ